MAVVEAHRVPRAASVTSLISTHFEVTNLRQ
jgi:hypothetical protein